MNNTAPHSVLSCAFWAALADLALSVSFAQSEDSPNRHYVLKGITTAGQPGA